MSDEKKFKSGFVNIIGNPNVGKSTLMNLMMKERLVIATHKAQTTRHRIKGILTGDDYQIVFSDTPGVLDPAYELQAKMMDAVNESLVDTVPNTVAMLEDSTEISTELPSKVKRLLSWNTST